MNKCDIISSRLYEYIAAGIIFYGRICMAVDLVFNRKFLDGFVSGDDLESIREETLNARKILEEGSGAGNAFLGWLDLPFHYDREEYERIKKAAEKIRSDSDVLIVIGVGGSYLGAKAAIGFLNGAFGDRKGPEVCFVGNSMSGDYIAELIDHVRDRDFSINVISKSGTTTEPAIAFRIFRELIETKYGSSEASRRIYATTDRSRGALKKLSLSEGYEQFTVPDNVGGRYSVLTAVGLLPIAVSGANIDAMMRGAADMCEHAHNAPFEENGPMLYAACRNILYRKGKTVELFAGYEPSFGFVSEWWKQLFGESEGKGCKGIFPASVNLTTDLHSIGQYIQDGERILSETVLDIVNSRSSVIINSEEEDLDGLNYLAGKNMNDVNHHAMRGAILAHNDGGVPVMKIELRKRDEYALGQLFYFFEYACGVSGYILGVNPFDQPGVESYKKNMFALLGKPGYESLSAELYRKL